MILNYQKWLPENAILDGELEAKFQATVERWAVKWFNDAEGFSTSLVSSAGMEEIEGSSITWSNDAESIITVLMTSDITGFAQRLLNNDFSGNSVNSADEMLFESLSIECVEDLQSGLCKDFLLSENFSCLQDKALGTVVDKTSYLLRIQATNNSVEITMILPRNFLAAARKASLRPDTLERELGMIEDAVAEQIISLGACVGAGTINLLDVENLSKGDVLVLESDITEPISVTINKSVIEGLNCHILQDSKTDSLKITQIMMDEV